MGVFALGASTMVVQAQDYDDIYYDGSSKVKTEKSEPIVASSSTTRSTSAYAKQQPTAYRVKVEKNYQAERDVDEYNRRGISEYDPMDTTYIEDEGNFANTQRIERFYNPDIVVASNDADLIEIYYDDTPSVNLIIGSNWGYTPRVGWGIGYGSYWYDPWYSWYDPFYSPWYGWHRPYYSWYGWGWHSPYWYSSWSWGWGYRPYYYSWGWSGYHHYGWGHSGHHWNGGHHGGHGYTPGARRPGDSRSLLSGPARRANRGTSVASAPRTNRSGISGINRSSSNYGGSRSGVMNSGRTRPTTSGSSSGVMSGGRSRTSSSARVGNVGSTTFRVRKLPDPTPFITYKDANGQTNRFKGGKFSKALLMAAPGLDAAIDDDMLNIDYKVVSFATVFVDAMGNGIPEMSNGSQFSERQKTRMRSLQRGKFFLIRNVKATGPDGITRTISSMDVTVN